MTAPRHLWSGDWRRESATAAQEFAERRGPIDAPAEPPLAKPPAARASALDRIVAALRNVDARRVRGVVLIGVATLLSAGAAYGAVSALMTSGTQKPGVQQSSRFSGGPAWLGVATASFPPTNGAMIVDVVPGSPAAAAGLQPGELITEIDNHPVQSPADLDSALAGLYAGQQAQIGYQLGSSTYTTRVTLKARPSGP
jgi:S1-C subfamily serine protease